MQPTTRHTISSFIFSSFPETHSDFPRRKLLFPPDRSELIQPTDSSGSTRLHAMPSSSSSPSPSGKKSAPNRPRNIPWKAHPAVARGYASRCKTRYKISTSRRDRIINTPSRPRRNFCRAGAHKNARNGRSIKGSCDRATKPETIVGLGRRRRRRRHRKEHQRHFDISTTAALLPPRDETPFRCAEQCDHLHFAAELEMKESHGRIFCATPGPPPCHPCSHPLPPFLALPISLWSTPRQGL